jgi:hypothetical protein
MQIETSLYVLTLELKLQGPWTQKFETLTCKHKQLDKLAAHDGIATYHNQCFSFNTLLTLVLK